MTLLWSGLALGAVYALVAVGYDLVYLVSRTFNFAHAQLVMVGAFVAYSGLVLWHLPTLVVAVIAAGVVGVVAAVEYGLAVAPVRDQHNVLVTTLGASILLQGLVTLKWGSQPRAVPFFGTARAVNFLGGRAYPVELALIAAAITVVGGFVLIGSRTSLGSMLLAVAEDPEAAQLRGINVRWVTAGVFIASGVFAGALGILVGPKTLAASTLGSALAIKGFVALAIGGFGSLPGSLVGGFLVGLIEAGAARYLGSQYSNPAIFLVLVAILLLRPSGLFVRSVERSV